jgi:hypothetical protein
MPRQYVEAPCIATGVLLAREPVVIIPGASSHLKKPVLGVELPAMTAREIPADTVQNSGNAKPDSISPDRQSTAKPVETGGPRGPEPTRYGDWEKNGRCIDF